MSLLRCDWIKATRKRHRCAWCAEWIETGSVAQYISGVYEGELSAGHLHPECAAAIDSPPHDPDGWIFWENSRGEKRDEYGDSVVAKFSDQYRGENPERFVISSEVEK